MFFSSLNKLTVENFVLKAFSVFTDTWVTWLLSAFIALT